MRFGQSLSLSYFLPPDLGSTACWPLGNSLNEGPRKLARKITRIRFSGMPSFCEVGGLFNMPSQARPLVLCEAIFQVFQRTRTFGQDMTASAACATSLLVYLCCSHYHS